MIQFSYGNINSLGLKWGHNTAWDLNLKGGTLFLCCALLQTYQRMPGISLSASESK